MKFLCDRCKTRYSIGDERVRGKILKIRCKNCANVITVREGMTDADAGEPDVGAAPQRRAKPTTMAPAVQEAAQPAAPPVAPPKAPAPAALEEEWYVSIDGEQSGPFSLQEAQKWISAKPLTADLHCWSEGFDDWLPVDKVSHFRGLRKKATAPNPVVPAVPPPLRVPTPPVAVRREEEEEEPKPLFAATMAAIERSVAPAVPKATPIGGTPSYNLPTPLPGPLPTPPAIPRISNGSQPHQALRAQATTTPAKPLPAFDVAADVPTQMDAAPFDGAGFAGPGSAAEGQRGSINEAPKPPIQRSVGLPAPFAAPPKKEDPFAAKLEAPKPEPKDPFAHFNAMPAAKVPDPRDIDMPSDEEMEIGEVSRVVNLADLAKSAAQKKAAAGNTGPQPRMRTHPGAIRGATGSMQRLDPIDAMVATPSQGFDSAPIAPQPEPPPPSHKRMYILLGVVVVLLLVVVGAVVFVVSQHGDDDPTALAQNRDLDLSRPDDPAHPRIKTPVDDGSNGSAKQQVQPHRPYVPGIPNKPGSNGSQTDVPEPTGNALKADEVEAMARTQSDATNRCYMRAQRGADAIIVGDVKKINVTLTIDPAGTVSDVGLSDHAGDSLGKCLQARIKGWKFRTSDKGLTTRLTLVFSAT